jgi:hypothetical protein
VPFLSIIVLLLDVPPVPEDLLEITLIDCHLILGNIRLAIFILLRKLIIIIFHF